MKKTIYTPKYKQVVERLKTARLEVGFTQSKVAQKLGQPQSFISKIERGERRLDVAELAEVAKIYKKDIKYFL